VTEPPPLPASLSRPGVVAAVGTALWAGLAVVLLVAWLVAGRPLDLLFSTSLSGILLGAFGYGVFVWQRSAARRGSRSAQQGAE